jgi:hypothetical protein
MKMLEKGFQSFAQAAGLAALLGLSVLIAPAMNADADDQAAVVQEILQVLSDRGLIDESEHLRLAAKAKAAENGSHDVAAKLLEGFEWNGDLRLRYETFWYDSDSNGETRENRYRLRYRARLGFKKKVNDWATVAMRFGSGQNDARSANRTLGFEEDFDPDPIFIDLVYADMKLPEAAGIKSRIHAGKIPNPFVWKHGKDFLMIEKDVHPEGLALLAYRPLSERTQLFFHGSYSVVDENSTSPDPKLIGAQIGGTTELSEKLKAGLRFSGYQWRSLNTDFVTRATAKGNLSNAFDGKARIGDVTAFAKCASSPTWPLQLYGTYVKNFNADSDVIGGISVDEEDTAWGLGLELGSSKKWFKLGVSYWYLGANSVVAQFTDSDLFDGLTNRRGWFLYASRMLAPGVELKMEVFDSDSIKNSAPYSTSVANADRKRLRADLIFRY